MLKLIAFVQAYTNDFAKNEEGATAIEYGLIASGIALAISVAVWAFGDELELLFQNMGGALSEGGAAPT